MASNSPLEPGDCAFGSRAASLVGRKPVPGRLGFCFGNIATFPGAEIVERPQQMAPVGYLQKAESAYVLDKRKKY